MLVNDTPLEFHQLRGRWILVKRDDKCSPLPGPMFSKMRGVVSHIQNRPEGVIGVLDTLHSKAGWCVAYVCSQLGKKCVDYWPRYTSDPREGLPRPQQVRAAALGATMVAMKAGRSAILYHGAKKHLKEHFGPENVYLMPNALKLEESIVENAAEAGRTFRSGKLPYEATLVISISSGTVAAGVLQGLERTGLLARYDVVLHMGYSRSIDACRLYMEKMSGLDFSKYRIRFVDEGFGYADKSRVGVPFPCNPYYDAKLWEWLGKDGVLESFEKKDVVFWNIGA